jgi:hypothetical protein
MGIGSTGITVEIIHSGRACSSESPIECIFERRAHLGRCIQLFVGLQRLDVLYHRDETLNKVNPQRTAYTNLVFILWPLVLDEHLETLLGWM